MSFDGFFDSCYKACIDKIKNQNSKKYQRELRKIIQDLYDAYKFNEVSREYYVKMLEKLERLKIGN